MPNTFIVCNGSLVRGYKIICEGIQTARFAKNPAMFFNHNYYDKVAVPIGRWENLRLENGTWLADAVFDTKDEFAQKIAQKVADGFLKGASITIKPLSYEKEYFIDSEGNEDYRYNIATSELIEISIVSIPEFADAVKLHFDNTNSHLQSYFMEATPPTVKQPTEDKKIFKNMTLSFMKALTSVGALLGIVPKHNDKGEVTFSAEQIESLNKEVETLRSQVESFKAAPQTDVKDLTEQLAAKEKEIAQYKADIDKKDAELAQLKGNPIKETEEKPIADPKGTKSFNFDKPEELQAFLDSLPHNKEYDTKYGK
jgi:hypothetical protein